MLVAHSEPSQISKMELFAKIVKSWKPFTIFVKSAFYLLDWIFNMEQQPPEVFYEKRYS